MQLHPNMCKDYRQCREAFAYWSQPGIKNGLMCIKEYAGQLTREEVGDSSHFIVTSFETKITKLLFLDTTFTWNRISNPKPEKDETVPEPDDYRLSVGLGVDF